jgi:type I restriction enzyme S subunit
MPKYVYYVFQTINWLQHNEASGVPSLSKAIIEKISISLPRLSEQQKIADFLSSLDAKIDLVEKPIQATKLFKEGLLQQLFV